MRTRLSGKRTALSRRGCPALLEQALHRPLAVSLMPQVSVCNPRHQVGTLYVPNLAVN